MKSYIALDDTSSLSELSPILTCIRSIQGSEALWENGKAHHLRSLSFKELKNEFNLKNGDGFCIAVSLQDGTTLYVSNSITTYLGYPKDMLVGQCIMNFLYQKDHITFANHLTQGLNACFNHSNKDDPHLDQNAFFCRFRVYHGLKFGYGVSERKVQYKPFKITLHINDLILDDVCVEKMANTLCVKATATPLSPGYQVPEEIPAMTSFSTRHTASCHFSHVDASAIPYLGYLPQDMVGYSIFDFYHTDDMPQLKDIYELVIKEQGSSFRSKPYRFRVINGCFITLETEWSCFINPWSRKLEFVVGQHRVLKGPDDINIFNQHNMEENIISDEILKESLCIQKEIRNMLSQPIKNYGIEKTRRFCNKRKRDLASFVCNFVGDEIKEMKKEGPEEQGFLEGCNCSIPFNPGFVKNPVQDNDSVVMGEISPHQELNDSDPSTETPPSFQEIRYQENIERFFASQPKTFSDGSEECKNDERQHSNISTDDEGWKTSGTLASIEDKDQGFIDSPSSTTAYNTRIQGSSSTSSKHKMSSFTTSGSGNELGHGKDNAFSVDSNYTNSSGRWHNSGWDDTEKLPLCLTLTEESLSQHNRLNHKYLKQRKNKTNPSSANISRKENHWMKHNEIVQSTDQSSSHKHKKSNRTHNLMMTSSIPTQTDNTKTSAMHSEQLFSLNPPFSVGNVSSSFTPTVPFNPQPVSTSSFPSAYSSTAPFGMPTFPCMPTTSATPSTPAPFFMPVMYMGAIPFYPSVSNLLPQPGSPVWPCAPMPPLSACPMSPSPYGASFVPSSNCGLSASQTFPSFSHPTVSTQMDNKLNIHSSGATATSSVLTTTTTVASGTVSSFKDINFIRNTSSSTKGDKKTCNTKAEEKERVKFDVADCDMQMDDTKSFCFTPSFSRQDDHMVSFDKVEDMDFEVKMEEEKSRPIRQNPPWLEGVDLNSDVIYRYQISTPNIEEVLKRDMEALRAMQQPDLVNKQLVVLQNELEGNENKDSSFVDSKDHQLGVLGFATLEDEVGKDLEDNEECILQLMAGDI